MPALTLDQVQQEVFESIKTVAGIPKKSKKPKFSLDTSLEELGFDSLEIVELQLELEDRFKINIPDKTMQRLYPLPSDVSNEMMRRPGEVKYGKVRDLVEYVYRRSRKTAAELKSKL
jgi:acyl carrier protein